MRRPSGGAYPAGDYFFHQDDQGNVLLVTDASGAVVERYDYDDFGAPTILDPSTGQPRAASAIGNRFLFTGREWDPDTKLYHYRFRDYDPATGRFLQRDPIGIWGDLANLGNGTAYVGNNPWSAVDPYGLQTSAEEYLNAPARCATVADWMRETGNGERTAFLVQSGRVPDFTDRFPIERHLERPVGSTVGDYNPVVGELNHAMNVISYYQEPVTELMSDGAASLSDGYDAALSMKMAAEDMQNGRPVRGGLTVVASHTPFVTGKMVRKGDEVLDGAKKILHHSDPKFLGGGDVDQLLTEMEEGLHKALHKDLYEFLKEYRTKTGLNMVPSRVNPGKRIQLDVPREERLKAMAEFYKKYGDKYPEASCDFFNQHPGLR